MRVARYRERLIADGLRPVQFLVADLRQEPVLQQAEALSAAWAA